MQEESIKEARKIIIDHIHNSDINLVDKLELLINLNHFLDTYEETTGSKVYRRVRNERRNTNNGNS